MMQAITLDEIEAAARIVYAEIQATPQYCWPLLCECLGTEVWVKHENHTPIGSFKMRGGLVYSAHLAKSSEMPKGVVSATREIMGSLLVLLLGATEFRLQS
jgi:threonine dehydratase